MPNTSKLVDIDHFREKLIDVCKQANDELRLRTGCSTWGDFADILIANGVTVQGDKDINVPSKWIPVTERLPEGDKVVLCYKADRGIRLGKLLDATYANGVQAFMDRDRVFAFGVTHWMPLPEAPKGE